MTNQVQRILVNHTGFYPPLRQALEAKGFLVEDIAWQLPANGTANIGACVIWFYDCLRHPLKVWRLRQQLRQRGIPLLAWNRDAPHYLNRKPWRLNLLNRFRLLDIYATHTLIDTRRQFADASLYFPNAADTGNYNLMGETNDVFTHLRDENSYTWDVSFFGGMDGQRYKEDQARADFFAALGGKLKSRNIRFRFQESAGMSVAEQVQFIQRSKINLNFGARCEYQASIASGLPERCYGIPSAGGFLLCDKRTHAQTDFTIGDNWAEFDGLDDCVEKIEFWLSHFAQARALAERCHQHVMQHHTYANRADKLIQALQAWHQGQRGVLA